MVVGVTMVRDELDILPYTLAHMLTQVDAVVVADNGSRDKTYEWLRSMSDSERLHVVQDREVGYFQSRKVSALAHTAMAVFGARWIVPWDADEVWLARRGGRVADLLAELPKSIQIAEADLWDHVATAEDPDDPDPLRRIGWRRPTPAPLRKVACRAQQGLTIAQGNHDATFAHRDLPGRVSNLLTIRHYPWRSDEQAVRKIRNGAEAYAATDLPDDQGSHWRGWGRILAERGDAAIVDLWRTWHYREHPGEVLRFGDDLQPALVYDPAPCLQRS